MFDPTDEETAMSPLPCFATKTLVIRSGTEVPAAKKVRPITCKKGGWAHRMGVIQLSKIKASYHSLTTDGIPTASPTIVVHQTMR